MALRDPRKKRHHDHSTNALMRNSNEPFEDNAALGERDDCDAEGISALHDQLCDLLMSCHRMAVYLGEESAADHLIALRLNLKFKNKPIPALLGRETPGR